MMHDHGQYLPYTRRGLCKSALDQCCRDDGYWQHTRRSRLFYTVKAVVSVLIGRTKEARYLPRNAVSPWNWVDPVEVAYLRHGSYSTPDGTFQWYEVLLVPQGVRRWWYEIESDST